MGKKTEVSEGEKKPKRYQPPRPEQTAQTEPNEITEMLMNGLAIYNLPEIDTDNVEQVEQRVSEYFRICAERGMKPSVSGFAMAFGVSRKTMWAWVNGQTDNGNKLKPLEVRNALKKAYQILNYAIEEYMQNGKINPVSGIFLMKNNFGYKDQSEVVLTPNNPLGEATDRSTLEQKYLDALPSGDAESAEVDLSETQKATEEG